VPLLFVGRGKKMIGKLRSFFFAVLSLEKLPQYPIRQEAGKGFLSSLLAYEELPASTLRQNTDRSFISNLLTNEKIPSGIKPQ